MCNYCRELVAEFIFFFPTQIDAQDPVYTSLRAFIGHPWVHKNKPPHLKHFLTLFYARCFGSPAVLFFSTWCEICIDFSGQWLSGFWWGKGIFQVGMTPLFPWILWHVKEFMSSSIISFFISEPLNRFCPRILCSTV